VQLTVSYHNFVSSKNECYELPTLLTQISKQGQKSIVVNGISFVEEGIKNLSFVL
jgi:hypothetical protein